jgi:hypothetical protein
MILGGLGGNRYQRRWGWWGIDMRDKQRMILGGRVGIDKKWKRGEAKTSNKCKRNHLLRNSKVIKLPAAKANCDVFVPESMLTK